MESTKSKLPLVSSLRVGDLLIDNSEGLYLIFCIEQFDTLFNIKVRYLSTWAEHQFLWRGTTSIYWGLIKG